MRAPSGFWDINFHKCIKNVDSGEIKRENLYLVCSFEGQKLVSIVLVLLLTGFDFGGETGDEVGGEGLETVEDGDYAILFGEGWDDKRYRY